MAAPIAGAVFGWAANNITGVADNAFGRPVELWTRTIQAEGDAEVRKAAYRGNVKLPNHLPSPDAIMSAFRRGLLTRSVAFNALLMQGIAPPFTADTTAVPGLLPGAYSGFPDGNTTYFFRHLWENIGYMAMQRPAAGEIAMLNATKRVLPATYDLLRYGLDVEWEQFAAAARARYEAPGVDVLYRMWQLGRISAADYDIWAQRAGWTNNAARSLWEQGRGIATLGDALVASWRGAITPADLLNYQRASGIINPTDKRIWESASRPIPGPADLVRFAMREVWDAPTVAAWGYDDEFPPEFAHWMKWQGLDWGEPVTMPSGIVLPPVKWPLAYWRAHWQIISPQQAYQAYRQLRPGRLARYADIAPGLTPFTAEDLRRVLKVSDYPPRMRAWLAAISTIPMSLAQIRQAWYHTVDNPGETLERLQDHGYTAADSVVIQNTWFEQSKWQAERPLRSFRNRLLARAFGAAEGAFRDGLIDRTVFAQRLLELGATEADANRAAALVELELNREEVKETLAALRRAWLQGALTLAALEQGLRQVGLSEGSRARLVRRWTRQRGLTRRMLSTSQVTHAVTEGALSPSLAALSLANLGWAPPDVSLLLSDAQAKLAQRSARESLRIAQRQKATQREQVRALRQAEAAQNHLRGRLRSITPLTALRRWLALGIRGGAWIRSRMALLGYDTSSIDAYLSQWVMENERAPHPEAPAAEGAEKLVRRQTGRGTVKSWFQNGVVTESWTRQRLRAMGYDHGTAERYILEWRATLGKKPGPAAEPIGPAAEPPAPQHTGAREVHQEARTVHQEPGRAMPPPG